MQTVDIKAQYVKSVDVLVIFALINLEYVFGRIYLTMPHKEAIFELICLPL